MITIILAAGNNKRFKGKHKATLLARNGKTIIENIVDNLDADPFLVIAQKKHKGKLSRVFQELSIRGGFKTVFRVQWIAPTLGPLDTLWNARERISRLLDAENNGDTSIVISYCDVLLEHKYYRQFLRSCNDRSAGIVVFESDNPRFQGNICGSYKLSGIFYFKSGKKMMQELSNHNTKITERGIADLVYREDYIEFICNEVIDIGVPKDYEEYING